MNCQNNFCCEKSICFSRRKIALKTSGDMLGLRKRKHCEEDAEDDAAAAISGDLKRVRITITAGELRYVCKC